MSVVTLFQYRLHLGYRNRNSSFCEDGLDVLQAVSLIDGLTDVVREKLRDLRARLADLAGCLTAKSLLCREDIFV